MKNWQRILADGILNIQVYIQGESKQIATIMLCTFQYYCVYLLNYNPHLYILLNQVTVVLLQKQEEMRVPTIKLVIQIPHKQRHNQLKQVK